MLKFESLFNIIQSLNPRYNIMEGHQSVSMPNLVLDVPKEILAEYLQHLDLKSSIMFLSTCKKTQALDVAKISETGVEIAPKLSSAKKLTGLAKMIRDYVDVLKNMYSMVISEKARDCMMANILRKLIYTSVSISSHFVNSGSTIAFEQCRAEYDRLYLYLVEEMDLDIKMFNNLLEDAQFEFRGFKIINISDERQQQLDMFKSLLKDWYFDGLYTVQANIQYDDTYMEIYNDGESIVFDIHQQHAQENDNDGGLIFFQDLVDNWKTTAVQDSRLRKAFDEAGIVIEYNRLQWSIENEGAPDVIAELMIMLMPNPMYFTGGDAFEIEVWNSILEENWLLNEVVKETMDNNGFEDAFCRASFQIVDEFIA